jgi:hypothetical protein
MAVITVKPGEGELISIHRIFLSCVSVILSSLYNTSQVEGLRFDEEEEVVVAEAEEAEAEDEDEEAEGREEPRGDQSEIKLPAMDSMFLDQ